MKNIAIIGSTGSIGTQTLEVIDLFPDHFNVVALAAGSNTELLAEQAARYRPQLVCIGQKDLYHDLKEKIGHLECKVTAGPEGLVEVATFSKADVVVTSITGALGLVPTVEAIKSGKNIALANKETLVAAGDIVMALAHEYGVKILPVDSEHSAIFQCLNGEDNRRISKLILTASGGPFRGKNRSQLVDIGPEDALRHPNWSMGAKITVDSATLMNKGLEVIEAKWLFGVDLSNIDVVIHPQSVIHSMVEFVDGSIIAQLGLPDMKLPIQYALTYPQREPNNFPRLDLSQIRNLTFEEPDRQTFSCLDIAFAAARKGGTMPAVMNAANEEAVALFLKKKIKFLDIPNIILKVMERHRLIEKPQLSQILECDAWARQEVYTLL
ncbi:1-deoxy-D-xylulose-5-phosphate reductoisomerase [Thermincola potens]|uniref:1-deoxy-D-xylulose 5-phosphate reductoisomerase n=1 Tax=Thermincola potens (strain JR) TaxID=635013 RepID=D5XF01_THEPJ|nr:1-deoxy-D-xylulose-5-phosphate reductoisomerase [Thermincola potens]ADG82222.1 1-deoxy-D-xylulose 5-phosphate reductoisomerase [Thermincola potens JR]